MRTLSEVVRYMLCDRPSGQSLCAIYGSTNCAVNLQIDPTSSLSHNIFKFCRVGFRVRHTDASSLGICPPEEKGLNPYTSDACLRITPLGLSNQVRLNQAHCQERGRTMACRRIQCVDSPLYACSQVHTLCKARMYNPWGSIVCAEQSMDCLDPYFAHGTIHGLRARAIHRLLRYLWIHRLRRTIYGLSQA